MLVFALGIKAVGKSRVLQELQKHVPGIKEISYGDVMLDIAKEKEGIADREQIAALPPAKQKKIREEAAQRIRKAADETPFVFLNTHGFIYTLPHHAYLPGSPDSVSDLLKPEFVLLVEADAKEIIARRERDARAGRKREIGTAQELQQAMDLERGAAVHLSVRYGCNLKVFDNSPPIGDNPRLPALAALFKSLHA
jgi:adenylate kinase